MGRRSRARSDDLEYEDYGSEDCTGSRFPLVVATLSTTAALLLFLSGTVPTMREDRHLREVEAERARIRRELFDELDSDVANRLARKIDIQSVLVELDRRGVDARPILFPEPDPDQPPWTGNEPPSREGR